MTKIRYIKDGKEDEIEVIEVIAQKWKFGTVGLGLKDHKVTNCHHVGQKEVDTCREILQIFFCRMELAPKFEKPTWRNVITAVRDTDFGDLADELKESLPLWYDQKK